MAENQNLEQQALANPPVAPSPSIPNLYDGLRVKVAPLIGAANAVSGGAVGQVADLATRVAGNLKDTLTDPHKRLDFFVGMAQPGGEGADLEGLNLEGVESSAKEGITELSAEAAKLYKGLRVRKPDEIMQRPIPTSRATPTGEAVDLPAELHAELEAKAGRKLTTEEANNLDRANREQGMVDAPDESTSIREDKRAQLEKSEKKLDKSDKVVSNSKVTPQQAVENSGMVYKGELVPESKVHMFEHPDHPGKTASLKEPFTEADVKSKMANKLTEFGLDKLGKK